MGLARTVVFDGHNDALTSEDHAAIAAGRSGGHLDLPRMRLGGVRGAIFAVFTESAGGRREPLPREDGVLEFELAPVVAHADAAAHAAVVIERLRALERAGEVRIARSIGDIDAAGSGAGPPAAVLHLEGAEAIDPGLEALDELYDLGLRSLGLVWSRPNDFAHGVPFVFGSSPDTGPGLTPRRPRAGAALRAARRARRSQPSQRARLLGCRRGSTPAR